MADFVYPILYLSIGQCNLPWNMKLFVRPFLKGRISRLSAHLDGVFRFAFAFMWTTFSGKNQISKILVKNMFFF